MRLFAALLRVAVVLCAAAAAVTLAALSGEYPGSTAAGRGVAIRDVLPLALLAWLHLGALAATTDARTSDRARDALSLASIVADVALLARTVPHFRAGAPPLSLALPWIAAFLLASTAGLAWSARSRR